MQHRRRSQPRAGSRFLPGVKPPIADNPPSARGLPEDRSTLLPAVAKICPSTSFLCPVTQCGRLAARTARYREALPTPCGQYKVNGHSRPETALARGTPRIRGLQRGRRRRAEQGGHSPAGAPPLPGRQPGQMLRGRPPPSAGLLAGKRLGPRRAGLLPAGPAPRIGPGGGGLAANRRSDRPRF